jgi:hypothetical protein
MEHPVNYKMSVKEQQLRDRERGKQTGALQNVSKGTTVKRGREGNKHILERGCFRGRGSNNDSVFHGVVLLEGLDELGDGGTLLSDGDVYTVKLLGLVVRVVPSLLVKHSVEGNGSLSGLTITDDQLTLTTTDGHHGVDGLETGLYGLVDGMTGQNTRSLELGTAPLGGLDGTLAIDGVAESVDNAAEKTLADGNIDLCMLVKFSYGGIQVICPKSNDPYNLVLF